MVSALNVTLPDAPGWRNAESLSLSGTGAGSATALLVALGLMSALFWGAASRSDVRIDGVAYHYLDDDQLISMRYARNLAEGHGAVWNPGERVEGYTNFGWVLVMAAVHWAGASDATASWWVRAINWLLACWVLVLAHALLHVLGARGATAAAALVPLAVAMDLLYWAVNGFETTLLTALFLWCVLRTIREASREGIRAVTFLLAGLLPIVRADAFDLLAGVVLLAAVLDWARTRWRAALVLLPVVCHLAFRVSYYGDWLPNTFYLKVAGLENRWVPALGYLKGFGAAYVAAMVMAAGWALSTKSRAVRVLVLLPVAGFARVVYTGPDIFAHYRFLAPYVPLILVLAAAAAEHLGASARAARLTLAALLATVTVAWAGVDGRTRFADLVSMNGAVGTNTVVGVLMARHALPDSSVAVIAAGAVPYFSRLTAIDLLGKSDRHVARLPVRGLNPTGHNRYDMEWSLAKRPDFVAAFGPRDSVYAAERAAQDPNYEKEREGYASSLVLSRAFVQYYRDHVVPLAFLVEHSAVFVRADSPEVARMTPWREPVVDR